MDHIKSRVIKITIFLVTFIIALIVISTLMNMGNTDMTVEMSKASYPSMTLNVEGIDVNRLHGYGVTMQEKYMRETLTPISEDRKVKAIIKTHGASVSGISYEVRSLDTERLVEKTDLKNFVTEKRTITAEITIKDLIEKNKEYLLIIILNADGKEIRYYTRIVWNDNLHAGEEIAFVQDFHNKTFDKKEAKSLTTYLESNAEGNNTSFENVNIHSSFSQITWGDMNILKDENVAIQILEMDEHLASFKIDYLLSIDNDSDIERYQVSEYFRIRYTPERIYLLDYERKMNQIFDPENKVFVNDKILLGIVDEEMEIFENKDGNSIIFEQGNTLYEYKNEEGNLARIFTFYDEHDQDRTLLNQHDIKVKRVDENGNAYFMVYGYMNRGRHEGEVGVSVYYYDCTKNTIEEKMYIPYDKSYGMLKKAMEKLAFINKRHELYVYMNGSIHCINLDNTDGKNIVDNLGIDRLVTSQSNQIIAWETEDNRNIYLMDLETGKTRIIKAEQGQELHAIGFLDNDIVYGKSFLNDVIRDETGFVTTLIHTINIEDKNGELLKEYNQENVYITDTSLTNISLQMKRIKKDPVTESYVNYSDDQIMSNQEAEETKNKIVRVTTETKETISEIALMSNVAKNIKLQTPKEVLIEGGRNYVITDTELNNLYYVYAKGEIEGIYTKPYLAVRIGELNNGIVVNNNQKYIWQKGNRANRTEITGIYMDRDEEKSSLGICLSAMMSYAGKNLDADALVQNGKTALEILDDNIDAEILDLSGCTLSSALYYVSCGTPVMAQVDGNRYVLIVGYDEKNTIIMDPEIERVYKKGMNDSTEWFMENGNRFVAYVQ